MKKLLLFVMLTMSVRAQATDGILVYGEDTGFLLTPPKNWVVDTQMGAAQGINAILYPKGSSWQSATSVMYLRVVTKKNNVFEKFISDDKKQFQSDCPGIQIQNHKPSFEPENPTQIRRFVCGDIKAPNSEWVAYINAKKSFIILVASSRSESESNRIQPLFEKVLQNLVVVNVRK